MFSQYRNVVPWRSYAGKIFCWNARLCSAAKELVVTQWSRFTPPSLHHPDSAQGKIPPPAKNIRFGAAWLPFNWIKEEVRRTTSCVLKRPAFLQPLRPSAQSLDCWFIPRLALSHDTMIMKGMGCGGILCIIDCILPGWAICKTDRPLLHLGANYENLTAKLKKL